MTHDLILTGLTLLFLGLGSLGALHGLLEETPRVKGTAWTILGTLTLIAAIGNQCLQKISVIGSFGGGLVVLALLLLLLGLLITWRLKTPLVPIMILPAAMLFTAAGVRLREPVHVDDTDLLLKAHVLITLLSYAFIALASISALLFLLQDLRLRRRLQSRVPLPSLEVISRLLRTFNGTAWTLMIIAIGSGAWLAQPRDAGWSQDMSWTFYGMTGTWLALGLVVLASWKNWLVGRRLAQATFVIAGLALLSLLGGAH